MLSSLSVVFILHKKRNFPLRISSVDVIKSAVKADYGSMTPEGHRSSRPEVFCRKYVLENFVKFTGKHLCCSLFLNKVAVLHIWSHLIKKSLMENFIFRVVAAFCSKRSPSVLEHVYMRPEVNSNRFEISLRCEVTSLSAFT